MLPCKADEVFKALLAALDQGRPRGVKQAVAGLFRASIAGEVIVTNEVYKALKRRGLRVARSKDGALSIHLLQAAIQNVEPVLAAKNSPAPIQMPPGYRLAAILSFLLTRKAFKRYVEPVIADMQAEYIDALVLGHKWRACWIVLRGHALAIPGWLYAFFAGKLVELLRRGGGN